MPRRRWIRKRLWIPAAIAAALAVAVTTVVLVRSARSDPWDDAWPGSSFGVLVLDRATGTTRVEHDAHAPFRSASLVKLLIALDLLERPVVTEPDRTLVGAMLRTSDDDAASVLWAREGSAAIVSRTAARLGLTDTQPPASRSSWGYTATSAADVARVYSYVLDTAEPAVRDTVLGDLRATTRCAVDGRDQYLGIPHAAAGPWAAKQGWSGFGELPPGTGCTPAPASVVDPTADDRARAAAPPTPDDTGSDPEIDTARPVAHTSGTVGPDDATIVVVLSLHPEGTTFDEAARRLDDVTRGLVPGSSPRR